MIKQTLLALACSLGLSMALAGGALAAVDVNSADEAALTTVKGIGPAMARRIVEERGKQGAFKDANDLAERVKGLGPKSVVRLQGEGLNIGKGATLPGVKGGKTTAAAPTAAAVAPAGKGSGKAARTAH
ncbi:helix-hairpin-helix domain-containing protein [Cupriavidus gilardii]|uniref:ComEA family DNA-binding protein n=1 Tax=Cupriavidus gilardii TaxID=82541 RepID=UPI001ABDC979|nr:helix-hairpin-helix domain-containing protein [Cupriavidus gilardii]MBO4119781.1 helix-hairpin-helix domain-containing protein [Cupriavidus gilardii]